MDIVEKLLSRIKVNESGCFEWQGTKTKGGYGTLRHDGKSQCAHRLSYEMFRGQIRDGCYVCHRCDNPSCINPAHLFLGTQLENMRDANSKGRVPQGEMRPQAKLRAEAIVKLVSRYNSGEKGVDLAREFGVSPSHLSAILHGKKWTSVPRARVIRRKKAFTRSSISKGESP